MTRTRGYLVILHRYVGLTMAGFLVIAGLTGSALAFRSELDSWLNPRLFHVEQAGPVLSPSRIVAQVECAHLNVEILTLALPSDRNASAIAYVGPKEGAAALDYDQLFVEPATGAILGHRMDGALQFDRAHLMPFLYRFHYTLTMPGRWGRWLLGGVALAWMLDCFVGFGLTLPRGRPFWQKWRPIWTIKRSAGLQRLNLDLHRAFGLWLWAVLFLLALTSVSLNLNRELFRPALTAFLPTTQRIWDQLLPATPAMTLDWDAAATRAQTEAERRGWDSPVSLIHAARAHGFYMVSFGRPHQAGFGASSIFVSGKDGRILSVEEAGGGKSGDVVSGLMLPIHSGQVAGLPGRILICITGLVVAMLSITGVYVWWKKMNARKRSKRGAVSQPQSSLRRIESTNAAE
ncbi:PepSY-associated TM helix domain-containing protein [Novosphingobium resinovorum]|uniref:PepSY-associated TM helix domain-containing protein n=1 Tax=Novosphingobium resinovorum TaxID=158500 RepID=UPI002ED4821A|nr:PepSY-associated TM helix domain-containing protein [Novosphingobium resinovorum]